MRSVAGKVGFVLLEMITHLHFLRLKVRRLSSCLNTKFVSIKLQKVVIGR